MLRGKERSQAAARPVLLGMALLGLIAGGGAAGGTVSFEVDRETLNDVLGELTLDEVVVPIAGSRLQSNVAPGARNHSHRRPTMNKIIRTLAAALVIGALAVPTAAFAQDAADQAWRAGYQAYQNGDPAGCVTQLRRALSEGGEAYDRWGWLHMMLGICLGQRNQRDEAISELQRSVNDPRCRTDALVQLGQCFFQKDMLDLARKQLEKALEGLPGMSTRTKEILYNLGIISEKMEDLDAARGFFSRIYEADISFRDISTKMENLARS